MKNLAIVLVLLISINVFAQNDEFQTYSNGLIYSEATMAKLSNIVDSLNLKYKTCDLNKVFNSKSQTIGHVIKMKKGNIKEAKKDIKNQIDFKTFIDKYPSAVVTKEALIVKFKYKNYNDKDVVEFNEVNLNNAEFTISKQGNPNIYFEDMKGRWLYEYNSKSKYSNESLEVFYFPNNFESKPLKDKYAKMISYADCLIDTTTLKFKKDAKLGWMDLPKNWSKFSLKKKKELLDSMRNTKVVGMCSMDSSPREHAINIAILSAETTNWEVFLRSHLDILNDRFERVSDGSYAWQGRKTYIRELEELDIAISDLIFGISLRMENPAENHYYGSIGRIGRALAETQNRQEIEKNMLKMIKDSELDDYNRVLSFYLFLNYNHYISDERIKDENIEKIKQAASSLPRYLKNTMKKE